LFDSVHVSAYSLSGHDTPKPFNNTQGELPSRLRPIRLSVSVVSSFRAETISTRQGPSAGKPCSDLDEVQLVTCKDGSASTVTGSIEPGGYRRTKNFHPSRSLSLDTVTCAANC
jgi:hypothetical protein